ncbi:MAG: aspartyl protease family protein [Chloroflexota bacterium]|nr:aspartyl protease family protein [Chloroflexota bacterium]
MGRTEVKAVITGPRAEREFTFLVDTGSTLVGLPETDIKELGLTPVPNGRVRVRTANGIAERETFYALGELEGQGFGTMVVAAPIPLIGYELLENMSFRVNPVTQRLERAGDDEFVPPYQL